MVDAKDNKDTKQASHPAAEVSVYDMDAFRAERPKSFKAAVLKDPAIFASM